MDFKAPPLETTSYNHQVLDLRDYWLAIREGLPLPTFAPPNSAGLPHGRAIRRLKQDKQNHIINSPLSEEFYEASHGVDRLIVQDIRRRAQEDR